MRAQPPQKVKEHIRRLILIILDGWGCSPDAARSAIARAHTPTMDSLWQRYPHCQLITHGESVGLPPGQMGNSEVGHMNIGAGRVVWQDIMRIYRMIESGDLARHPLIDQICQYLQDTGRALHLCGLTSTGGVHSHVDHLRALVDIFAQRGVRPIYVHAFTDGRDTDIHQAGTLLPQLVQEWGERARLVSVIGRYYAMDRDRRWERTLYAYRLLTTGDGIPVQNNEWHAAIHKQYQEGITDEFLLPMVAVGDFGVPLGRVLPGDVLFCFNFRKDRCRQLMTVLTQQAPDGWHDMQPLPLFAVTMTEYDLTWQNIHVLLPDHELHNTWGEWLARHGLRQLRIAETEKYPHVTYFFSGAREEPCSGEERILVPSPRDVPTYDHKPEMSAYQVVDALLARLKKTPLPDFICLNFANPDMVGHTGKMEAVIRAVETVDTCLKKVLDTVLPLGYRAIVTADHGNADEVLQEDGSPHTAHTTNPVPCIFIAPEVECVAHERGILADLAPTGLTLMGLPIPPEMTGNVLVRLKQAVATKPDKYPVR